MSLSKRTRFEVFKRDGFKCQYCGRTPPAVVLQVDHVIPVSRGGKNSKDNLITACFDCNSGKSNVPLDQVIPAVVADIEFAKERLAQLRAYNKLAKQLEAELDLQADTVYEVLAPFGPSQSELRSIRHFFKQIGFEETLESAQIAVSRKNHGTSGAWKYFCGICWNKIKSKEAG